MYLPKEAGVGYAFIGPEAPLEAGIVDELESAGIACVGPTRAAPDSKPIRRSAAI